MKIYNDVLRRIMKDGVVRKGRNGNTKALFAVQMRFDLRAGFPAVTTKKLAFKAVKSELLWFLQMRYRANDEDLKKLNGSERTIWTDNAEADYWKSKSQFKGDLGRVYGIQWRQWQGPRGVVVDQIRELVEKLKKNPFDRRLVVSAWNPGELEDMALPPCHMLFQCFVDNRKRLSLHMVQRSCDMFIGVPFNIASYALLTHMLAQICGLKVGELILTLNDAHIYGAHYGAVRTQLSRRPMKLPELWLNPAVKDIDSFTMDDIKLVNYQSHPAIKAKMIV
jgi:thymidylate synthase